MGTDIGISTGIGIGIYLIVLAVFLAERKIQKVPATFRVYYQRFLVMILVVNTLAFIVYAADQQTGDLEKGNRLKRNKWGGSVMKETLRMKIDDQEEQTVEIEVNPREYSREEVQILFRQVMEQLDRKIAGENQSLDHVEKDLYLPEKLDAFPVTITWELSRYDVVDSTGRVKQDVIKSLEEAERGIQVSLTGFLRYQEQEALYGAEVKIYPEKKRTGTLKERVRDLVIQAEEETRQTEYMILPTSIEGHTISWSKETENRSILLLGLGVLGSVMYLLLEIQKKENQKKERRLQMLLDYPEIIEQFTMLMTAGMTAKSTWKKITDDYNEQKVHTGERAAYEEMLLTWKEMQSGITEAESYERFGRRCGLAPYMKFGALLSQNLRKGAKGISEVLNMEAIQAFEDRKSRAKRLGEEAGTKLLIPMFFMLVIVLLIVIVPAFLSVQM